MPFRSVILAVALACAGASSAFAQLSAPVISGDYYEQNGSSFCGDAGNSSSGIGSTVRSCRVNFAAAPAGKAILILHAACSLVVQNAGPAVDVYLAIPRSNVDGRSQRLAPVLQSQVNTTYVYLLAQDTRYLAVNPPSIVVATDSFANFTMDCQIVGTISNKA